MQIAMKEWFKYNIEIKLKMSFSVYFPACEDFDTPYRDSRMIKPLRLLTGETQINHHMENTRIPIRVVVKTKCR